MKSVSNTRRLASMAAIPPVKSKAKTRRSKALVSGIVPAFKLFDGNDDRASHNGAPFFIGRAAVQPHPWRGRPIL